METTLPLQDNFVKTDRKTSVEQLHAEAMSWISKLEFINYEIQFIKNLIISHPFEPKTAKEFELLQKYNFQIKEIETQNPMNVLLIRAHESKLNGMYDCKDTVCDNYYLVSHGELMTALEKHLSNFKATKVNIFKYCEIAMKYNKKPA